MRKYRGLTKKGKAWVYGWLFELVGKAYIIPFSDDFHTPLSFVCHFVEVIPKSVGQQIGLKDKNGKEGYQGDKVSFGSTRPTYLIKWSVCNAGFYLESMDEQKEHLVIANFTVGEIIGSIHQPEEQDNG